MRKLTLITFQDRGLTADYLFSTITANWDRKLPVWVMLMIESLTKSDIASRGVPVLDLYLSQQVKTGFETSFKLVQNDALNYTFLKEFST